VDSLNSVIAKVLGDEWGLFWTTVFLFFALVVKMFGQTDDLKRSPKARRALEYVVAMSGFFAAFAAVTVAWFVALETSGLRNEWWYFVGPVGILTISFILGLVLLCIAKLDKTEAPKGDPAEEEALEGSELELTRPR
jgi:hypothetical protein